ncbi:MAG: DUF3604 domain-containing protein [Myxococcota bacterium]
MRGHVSLTLCLAATLGFSQAGANEEPRCADFQPERQAFFGDLHVHTAISMDANMFGTRLRPEGAYRFARGETVHLVPASGEQPAQHPVRIERPLDFAAVTDHAMNFGFVHLCTTPGSEKYDSETCRAYRVPLAPDIGDIGRVVRDMTKRLGPELVTQTICGKGGALCRDAAREVWRETQQSAARFDDATESCTFTTFVAYEYTATPELTKIHRNVIFRNEHVPELPISYTDEPDAIELWRRLRTECIESGTGCDVLAIPHNSNLSNGRIFQVEYGDAETPEAQAEVARLRASMEPLVEMMQMKGDSECRNGMWNVLGATDEFCGFEKMRAADTPDCQDGTGKGALGGDGCVSRLDYSRYALVEGLREADRIGVNPYAFGLIAATDGHEALPGAVEESRLDLRMGRPTAAPGMNLGGLAGVWAEENSREALFEAMRRRETFGTSGPRLQVRFFGGWDYPSDLCQQSDLVAQGYAGGVPMGGDLPSLPAGQARGPRFVVSALRDPGTPERPGNLLQRVQVVKGWADPQGRFHQQVVDVAGGANGAGVDADSCAPTGAGAPSLCGVWTDLAFDPAQRAVYYARVIENPSCRTTGWACAQAPAGEEPEYCGAEDVAFTTQERAWSSPIWYAPEK